MTRLAQYKGLPCLPTTLALVKACLDNPNYLITLASTQAPEKPLIHVRYHDYTDVKHLERLGLVEMTVEDLKAYYEDRLPTIEEII